MGNVVEIIIPGIPIPWMAPYVGSRGAYSPRAGIMRDLKILVKSIYNGPFFEVPVHCSFRFYMPIPKATSKKKRALMLSGHIRPAKTPDRCNLCKFYEDVLQDIVYPNDALIVGGFVEKYYGEEPKTLIQIEAI